ncbi:hypothetical protein QNI16_35040 [Cytophagaceae bacterium YF14B1]|uniref:Uncharacterized protein n=1 Tax=Xanthocytophaga flava TaxID=3048013 RepID=A0AAE3QY88_9BACT|nr:hypothetical protein [Xanthocytophaga flavus]MDJ1485750.1 hypothetical protein [Xanthocytophaga flavus]
MYTFLKYFFGLLTLGALSETYRISTYDSTKRIELLPMSIAFTLLLAYLSVRFHYKHKNEQKKLKF